MQLDHSQLQKLLAFLAESDIQEFRLEGDDFRVEVRRNLPSIQSNLTPIVTTAISPPQSSTSIAGLINTRDLVDIIAPMVGTFYRAPAPGEPTFVELGSRIGVGQTVCILEAMKLMNELETEVSGEIVEILVDDGTPVEFGQILMRVKLC
uniref:Biotin carboxyl carrier protein of acetyl-CoA carboxylase n=1 Tax=Paulinella chromatophora TaxID=39717 RepID=B1X4J3_PAUCH|nr:acetyl-CoA carboxylase, biotin carboxyl carrier protein [Paulinella chromatophora]ACB42862.1 acetyl-CoA carboxylase, biotin carboxyl carrier protein [Paulinella chromatophora]